MRPVAAEQSARGRFIMARMFASGTS